MRIGETLPPRESASTIDRLRSAKMAALGNSHKVELGFPRNQEHPLWINLSNARYVAVVKSSWPPPRCAIGKLAASTYFPTLQVSGAPDNSKLVSAEPAVTIDSSFPRRHSRSYVKNTLDFNSFLRLPRLLIECTFRKVA